MEFTLKKKSWHLWLANFGSKRIGNYEMHCGTDICHYLRQMMWGTMTLLAAAFGVFMLTAWIGASAHNIYELIVGLETELWLGTFALGLLVSCFVLIIAYAYMLEKYKNYRMNHPKPKKQPGIVKLSYRKFKDKTCFRINFKDDAND